MDQERTSSERIHIVDFSRHFAEIYARAPDNDTLFVDNFVDHVEQNGLSGLPGRLKCSWDLPRDDPQYASKSAYAQRWNLWHYHLGLPSYDTSRPYGDFTSQWVLHLRRHPCGQRTTVVDWDLHPPFTLPKELYLHLPDGS